MGAGTGLAQTPSPAPQVGPTWLSPLHHAAGEHVLPEERPVVVLVHHDDLQVRGVLQGDPPQVQCEGSQLWVQSRGSGSGWGPRGGLWAPRIVLTR